MWPPRPYFLEKRWAQLHFARRKQFALFESDVRHEQLAEFGYGLRISDLGSTQGVSHAGAILARAKRGKRKSTRCGERAGRVLDDERASQIFDPRLTCSCCKPSPVPTLLLSVSMKITVMGASGLVGSRVVERLTSAGHEVTAASRASGADVVTGEGLAQALAGSRVVVDVLNSPSFNDQLVLAFFAVASAHLVSAAKQAGVGHYVALSIVGVDGLPKSAYMRAKVLQEKTIAESGLPYTILRATQFHEFTEAIIRSLHVGDEVRVPDASIQPIAADEVAAEVARVATETPLDGIIEIGGPEKISFAQMARTVLAAKGLNTPVIVDASATYFGTPVDESSLLIGNGATSGTLRLADWLRSIE